MIYTELTKKALKLCFEAHKDQVDKAIRTLFRRNVKNLLLYHTEDKNLEKRTALYIEEGSAYYHGNLFVPHDLESLEL